MDFCMGLGRYIRESKLHRMALRIRDEGWAIEAAAEMAGYPDLFSFRACPDNPPRNCSKPGKCVLI